jgi:hypothetical protein
MGRYEEAGGQSILANASVHAGRSLEQMITRLRTCGLHDTSYRASYAESSPSPPEKKLMIKD